MDASKVDLIIQYALAVAGEAEDYRERELGPIHLLKYVYLADLAFSQEHGTSFTDTSWRFHHFGPWSPQVHDRIPQAVTAIGGIERRFPSQFTDEDAVRWRLSGTRIADRLEERLPWSVARATKAAVRKHGNDTTTLLHEVYHTPPMLKATPGELLDFSLPVVDSVAEGPVPDSRPLPVLSKTRVRMLKESVQKRLEERGNSQSLVDPQPAPRYDEVFVLGQEWLDGQAGELIQPERGRLHFSNEVWKSPGRRDPEIS